MRHGYALPWTARRFTPPACPEKLQIVLTVLEWYRTVYVLFGAFFWMTPQPLHTKAANLEFLVVVGGIFERGSLLAHGMRAMLRFAALARRWRLWVSPRVVFSQACLLCFSSSHFFCECTHIDP